MIIANIEPENKGEKHKYSLENANACNLKGFYAHSRTFEAKNEELFKLLNFYVSTNKHLRAKRP